MLEKQKNFGQCGNFCIINALSSEKNPKLHVINEKLNFRKGQCGPD